MGLKYHKVEVEIKSPPEKFFQVMTGKLHLISSIASDHITGIDIHEGEWHAEVGAIKRWDFMLEGKPEHLVEKVIALDEENMSMTYDLIDGDLIKNHFKSYVSHLLVTPLPDGGGGVVTWDNEYEKIDEEDGPESQLYDSVLINMARDIDAHLLAASS